MDEDRRRNERRARTTEEDPDAYLKEALAHRRAGHLEAARSALDRAITLAPGHELARALLLLTEVSLGRRTRGSFAEARALEVDLVKFLEPGSLRAVADSALDPSHGPVDAEAIEALVASGKAGAVAVLDALGETAAQGLPDRLRIAVGLRARVIAGLGIAPGEVSEKLRLAIAQQVRGDTPDWLLLAGAVHMRELRPSLERALDSETPAVRYAAAVGLELLGDPDARPALRGALGAAKARGDRLLLERALEALGEDQTARG